MKPKALSPANAMSRALILAKKGGYDVAPNPMVGAVIVRDGRIVAEGYHRRFGGPHAEIEAIASVKSPDDLRGATLYVTLEPCRHHGKTPPCSEAIAKAGIEKVVYGSADPFQKDILRGLPYNQKPIASASLGRRCRELNRFFLTRVEKGRPWLTVKVAVSADGFVAGKDGQPVRITNDRQDKRVHELRANHQAIMVGINTVLNDNPQLNVRHTIGKNPLKVVLDSSLKIPLNARILDEGNTLIATTMDTDATDCPKNVQKKAALLRKKGFDIWKSATKERVDLRGLLVHLASIGINSVLVEPGPILYAALKKEGLIDELVVMRGQKRLGEGLKIKI